MYSYVNFTDRTECPENPTIMPCIIVTTNETYAVLVWIISWFCWMPVGVCHQMHRITEWVWSPDERWVGSGVHTLTSRPVDCTKCIVVASSQCCLYKYLAFILVEYLQRKSMAIRSKLPTHAQLDFLTSRCEWFDFGKRFYCHNELYCKARALHEVLTLIYSLMSICSSVCSIKIAQQYMYMYHLRNPYVQ